MNTSTYHWKGTIELSVLLLGVALQAACGSDAGTPDSPGDSTQQIQYADQTLKVRVVDGLAIFQGDIILGEIADLQGLKPEGTDTQGSDLRAQSIFRDSPNDYRWPGGVVPFQFEGNITATERQIVLDAMRAWEAVTPVRFVERNGENDFVMFARGTSPNWCFSDIGRQGGQQRVLLRASESPCPVATMTHELGHTLGLFHEQTREDRNQHIRINWNNLREGECRDAFEQRNVDNGLDVGPYDLNSIMHYDRFGCSDNGEAVYDTIPAGQPARGGERISAGDIAAVRWLYLRNWIVSEGGQSAWRAFGDLEAKADQLVSGDFNGDGRTDLFHADPQACVWYVSYSQGISAGPWQVLSTGKCESQSVMRFGDFDGDRRTDVFVTSGGVWWVSRGGVDWWVELNSSNAALSELAFADFNGDGRTDVFRGNGRQWLVSYGGSSPWEHLNTSNYRSSSLRFGDFNGDGSSDIFRSTGGIWYVSYSGTSPWQDINASNYSVGQLRFGDFNGDRLTDVYRFDGSQWVVSYGGTSYWTGLPSLFNLPPRTSVTSFLFGDFDGNGSRDVFATVR